MGQTARVYAGETAEERRVRRRAQLITAARELLGSDGWGATSMRSVCSRAGLGDRYFYESFDGRDALLSAVFDEIAADAVKRVGAVLADAAPEDRARAGIGALVDLVEGDVATRRALFDTPDSPGIHAHRRKALRTFAVLLAGDLGESGAGAEDPVDRELTAHALIGAFGELLAAVTDGDVEVSRDRLVAHAAAITGAVAGVHSA